MTEAWWKREMERMRSGTVILTWAVLLGVMAGGSAVAERDRLYTEPDASSGGGIRGTITNPREPIEQILAIPPDDIRMCYQGTVGTDGHSFEFRGLPMRRYDLVVIYANRFYEGLCLHRDADTLTPQDRQQVEANIQKGEPFFTVKIVHRLEGTTGRGNESRCIVTYLRDRVTSNAPKGDRTHRRTFKIVDLKQVGPGWQIVMTRDLYPSWVRPADAKAKHHYSEKLSKIRVTRSVTDVGEIDLSDAR